jgi:selenocysteine lyase/cysteine desulfurase
MRQALGVLSIADAQSLWHPERVYLNTASYGLPPDPAWEALEAALRDWRGGRTSWENWSEETGRARREFAALVGVEIERVAVGANLSSLVGTIAASLPAGTRVVAPEGDFTSLLFPFMAQAERGVEVALVPLARLADAIDERTDVVAFSVVQSATGEVTDLATMVAAARAVGAMTVIDGSQACGWLPMAAGEVDVFACTAYKWLMSPRGTAFMSVAPPLADRVVPHSAGWFAAEDVHGSYYAGPMRLARSARRFDTSPAWFSWVGTAPAIEVIRRIGVEAIQAHDVALANRFRAGLRMPPSDSAIVSADVPGAEEAFARAGVMTAVRGGRLRAAFHVYNTDADVDAALEALADRPRSAVA